MQNPQLRRTWTWVQHQRPQTLVVFTPGHREELVHWVRRTVQGGAVRGGDEGGKNRESTVIAGVTIMMVMRGLTRRKGRGLRVGALGQVGEEAFLFWREQTFQNQTFGVRRRGGGDILATSAD